VAIKTRTARYLVIIALFGKQEPYWNGSVPARSNISVAQRDFPPVPSPLREKAHLLLLL
jgi:hypothetical protein